MTARPATYAARARRLEGYFDVKIVLPVSTVASWLREKRAEAMAVVCCICGFQQGSLVNTRADGFPTHFAAAHRRSPLLSTKRRLGKRFTACRAKPDFQRLHRPRRTTEYHRRRRRLKQRYRAFYYRREYRCRRHVYRRRVCRRRRVWLFAAKASRPSLLSISPSAWRPPVKAMSSISTAYSKETREAGAAGARRNLA